MRLKFYGLIALILMLAGFGLTACNSLLNIPSTAVAGPTSTPTVCASGCCIPGPTYLTQWGTVYPAWAVAVSPMTGNVYVNETTEPYWIEIKPKPGQGGGSVPKPVKPAAPSNRSVPCCSSVGIVEEFDSSGNFITSWNNNANSPSGIAVEPGNGHVYVADYYNGVTEYTASGQYVNHWYTVYGTNGTYYLDEIMDIKFLGNGNLLIASPYYYEKAIEMTPGGAIVGFSNYYYPYSFAPEKNGNIYGYNYDSGQVQEADSLGNYLTNLTTSGSGCDQTEGVYGMGLANDGTLYAVDLYEGWIDVFTPNKQFMGQWTPPAYPYGIAISQNGKVYVTNGENYSVQAFQK